MYIPIILVLLIALMGYVRLAPQDPNKFHVPPAVTQDEDLKSGVKRRVKADILKLHEIIMAEPRTKLVAGDPSEGMATYVTRSLLWGFPDYTTVQVDGDEIKIFARLVFGKSDLGVNAARVERWIKALSA